MILITILAISNICLASYLFWVCRKFEQITNRYKAAFDGYDAVIADYKVRLELREKVIMEQQCDLIDTFHLN